MKHLITATASAAILAGATFSAVAQDKPFYEGKTLNFVVGYTAGGASDLSCRVFANHLGKHIAGNPTIVIRNMPGASGMNAINYVGEAARNDGLTALCGTVSIMPPLLRNPELRVDLGKFTFIMGVADSQVFFIRADVAPGIKEGEDIFKAQNIVYGGFAVDSAKDVTGRAYLDLLGIQYKYVTGYSSDGDGRTAIQQNFVNTWMEGLGSYVAVTDPTLAKPGTIVPIFQSGLLDNEGKMTVRDPAVPDTPTFMEFYKAHFNAEPEGPLWDTVNAINGTYAASQRSIGMAPGAPQEAVAALQAAVEPLLADEEFWKEARQVLGDGVQIFGGDRVQSVYQNALNPSESTVEAIKKMVETGHAATR